MATGHTTARMTAASRREQILDVTEAIVEASGFHGVSIDRVARESGITRPVVYTHFGDLDGLLNALVDRANGRTLDALGRIVPRESGGRPEEVLLQSLRLFLETVREDPVTWRLALMPPESAPHLLAERIARDRAGVVRALAAVVDPWLEEDGGLRPDAEFVARALVAISEESARVVLEDPEHAPVERILDHARWAFRRLG
jgi:AcrR family transcriptional regulator